jgi:hypothetical protein
MRLLRTSNIAVCLLLTLGLSSCCLPRSGGQAGSRIPEIPVAPMPKLHQVPVDFSGLTLPELQTAYLQALHNQAKMITADRQWRSVVAEHNAWAEKKNAENGYSLDTESEQPNR